MYNWRTIIYSLLVKSLNRASQLYNHQNNTVAMEVSDVVVLQVSIIVFINYIIVLYVHLTKHMFVCNICGRYNMWEWVLVLPFHGWLN